MSEEREITAPMEVTDLQQGWEGKAPTQPQVHALLRFGGKTDLGQVRENNEDKFDFIEPDDPVVLARRGRVYAVADGMGGHSAGQIASELGLKVFIRSYYQDGVSQATHALKRAVRDANAYIVEVARAIPGRGGMGTTLTAAIVREDDLIITQVGDSRLYQLRGGEIRQITQDHSWVAEHVRRGTMTEEEAEQSPHRNVITRSLGGAPEVEPDLYELKLQPGDRYLICSDGLSGMVREPDLLQVGGADSPSVAAWNLVELANENGGTDNVTVVVLDVVGIERWNGAEPPAEAVVLNHDEAAAAPEPAVAPAAAAVSETPSREGLMRRLFHRGPG